MAIPKETLLRMYRQLLTARRLDEKLYELRGAGFYRGTGEEAIPIAFCNNLRKDDYFKLMLRTAHVLFAKGLSLRDCIASSGWNRDLSKVGGHFGFFDIEYGLLGISGALGEDVAIYTGAALSAKLRKSGQVSVCTLGDGSANRAPVHESMVVAAAWKLPIVFVIQNNKYAMGTASSKIYRIEDMADRAKAYGFPGKTVDGNDIMATYEVAREFIDRARSGGGPGLVVADTWRLRAHFEGDPQNYRPKGEADEWWKKDPLPRYQKKLMEMGILAEADVSKLEKEIKVEIDEAAKAASEVPSRSYEDHKKTAIAEL